MKLEKFTVGELKNPTKETRDKLNAIVEELNKLHKEKVKNDLSIGAPMREQIMNICKCGAEPRLVEYFIKGSANHKNYFVKCEACIRRTRNRRLKQAAIDEWNEFGESKYMKWQDGISDYYGFRSYT